MLRHAILSLWLAASLGLVHAQEHPYRVVFDLTSPDSLNHQAVMRWVNGIVASNPNAELEVVMYGKGFEMLMPSKSTVLADVKTAMRNPKVSFNVCQVALKNNNVEKSQLVEGAQTVPDGIYRIVEKQKAGWTYIKVSR